MNRRGVLSMLGIGAAAGPAIAKQYVGNSVMNSSPAIPSTGGEYYDKVEAIPWNPVEQLASAKREYEMLTGDASKWITDYVAREWDEYMSGYSSIRIETIDPDIRNMKSFSESAKIRTFIERKAKRRYENQKNHMWSRIQELMKEI
jgi:hypothetical protein